MKVLLEHTTNYYFDSVWAFTEDDSDDAHFGIDWQNFSCACSFNAVFDEEIRNLSLSSEPESYLKNFLPAMSIAAAME